jgi:hypothetical protein
MHQKSSLDLNCYTSYPLHRLGEAATHSIARLSGRLTAPSRPFDLAQDRLAGRPANRTLGCVQLPFPGLIVGLRRPETK